MIGYLFVVGLFVVGDGSPACTRVTTAVGLYDSLSWESSDPAKCEAESRRADRLGYAYRNGLCTAYTSARKDIKLIYCNESGTCGESQYTYICAGICPQQTASPSNQPTSLSNQTTRPTSAAPRQPTAAVPAGSAPVVVSSPILVPVTEQPTASNQTERTLIFDGGYCIGSRPGVPVRPTCEPSLRVRHSTLEGTHAISVRSCGNPISLDGRAVAEGTVSVTFGQTLEMGTPSATFRHTFHRNPISPKFCDLDADCNANATYVNAACNKIWCGSEPRLQCQRGICVCPCGVLYDNANLQMESNATKKLVVQFMGRDVYGTPISPSVAGRYCTSAIGVKRKPSSKAPLEKPVVASESECVDKCKRNSDCRFADYSDSGPNITCVLFAEWADSFVDDNAWVSHTCINDLQFEEQGKVYSEADSQLRRLVVSSLQSFHLLIMIDISKSTRYYLDEIKKAALFLIDSLFNSEFDCVVAVYAFGGTESVEKIVEFTRDKEAVKKGIQELTINNEDRSTRFFYACYWACKLMRQPFLSKNPMGKSLIVLFSDGEETANDVNTLPAVNAECPQVNRFVFASGRAVLEVLEQFANRGVRTSDDWQDLVGMMNVTYNLMKYEAMAMRVYEICVSARTGAVEFGAFLRGFGGGGLRKAFTLDGKDVKCTATNTTYNPCNPSARKSDALIWCGPESLVANQNAVVVQGAEMIIEIPSNASVTITYTSTNTNPASSTVAVELYICNASDALCTANFVDNANRTVGNGKIQIAPSAPSGENYAVVMAEGGLRGSWRAELTPFNVIVDLEAKRLSKLIIILPICVGGGCLMLGFIIWYCTHRRKKFDYAEAATPTRK